MLVHRTKRNSAKSGDKRDSLLNGQDRIEMGLLPQKSSSTDGVQLFDSQSLTGHLQLAVLLECIVRLQVRSIPFPHWADFC